MKIAEKIKIALKQSNIISRSENMIKSSIQTKPLANPCLISEYLDASLYTAKNSYYQTKTRIGRLENNLPYSKMRGASDYVQEMNRVYPHGKYLTASEIFKPYFGYIIGNYILKNHEINHKDKPIIIVEFGCGMGIN